MLSNSDLNCNPILKIMYAATLFFEKIFWVIFIHIKIILSIIRNYDFIIQNEN